MDVSLPTPIAANGASMLLLALVVVAIPAAYNDDASVLRTPTIAMMELMVTVQILDGSIRPSLRQIFCLRYCCSVAERSSTAQLSYLQKQICHDKNSAISLLNED